MLKEMYVYNYLGDISVSRKEVNLFYNEYKDSIPLNTTKYDFSVIEIPIINNQKDSDIFSFQKTLLDSIKNGVDFASLAKKYSEDLGTAENGGDQGYYSKGTLFNEFEEVAFNLNINEVAGPIKTPIGYHLIQLLNKENNQIHTRHILNLVNITDEDIASFEKISQKIYIDTQNDPGRFDSLAVEYKNKYNNQSGIYKNYDINDISIELKDYIINSNSYELIKPHINNKRDKFQIIYVYNIQPQTQRTLENSWYDIENLAKNKKTNDLLIKLITKLKHNTFIQYYD